MPIRISIINCCGRRLIRQVIFILCEAGMIESELFGPARKMPANAVALVRRA
jgi:hypothetical protein